MRTSRAEPSPGPAKLSPISSISPPSFLIRGVLRGPGAGVKGSTIPIASRGPLVLVNQTAQKVSPFDRRACRSRPCPMARRDGALDAASPLCSGRRRFGAPARDDACRRQARGRGTRNGLSARPARRRRWLEAPGSACGRPAPLPSRTRRRRSPRTWRPGRAGGTGRPQSVHRSPRFLACWATQAESGWAVAPTRCTRRVESSMKNRT